MELVKRADQEVKFLDGSVVIFEIENISKDEKQVILNASKRKKRNIEKSDEDFLDKIDIDKFNMLVIRRAVKGWSDLKNKHLLIIYDCNRGNDWEFKGDKKRETEIPYSEELMRELSEMHSVNFMTWLNDALDRIDSENTKAKETELKN